MEQDEAFVRELFFNQMTQFREETAKKIIEILDKENYIIEAEVLGLIGTAKGIISVEVEDEDAKNALIETAIHMLSE